MDMAGDNDHPGSPTGDQAWSFEASKRTPGRFIVTNALGGWVCDLDGHYAEKRARLISASPALFQAAEAAAINALDIDGSDRVSISREHLSDLYAALAKAARAGVSA
jgi:hypothetical protein